MLKVKFFAVFLMMFIFLDACASEPYSLELFSSSPLERRRALIEAASEGSLAIPFLGSALYDENTVVRRTAMRLLSGIGGHAVEVIRQGLGNSDPEVRRMALKSLEKENHLKQDDLSLAMEDINEVIRLEAVRIISRIFSENDKFEDLLVRAGMDASPLVRREALRSLFGAGATESLRMEYLDLQVDIIKSQRLPSSGWRFRLDPEGSGHLKGWHRVDYEDMEWAKIGIEKAWQGFGYDYTGVAWYRGRFEMPEAIENCDGVEIHFEGVDESAWVWVNGQYAGDHDIGPAGWDVPFAFDITEFVVWGGENQITVRAMNTAFAGGIWRPVKINFLHVPHR